MYSLSAFGGGYDGRLNCRSVRSEELVTSRLHKYQDERYVALYGGNIYRPDFAKSRPFIEPAPGILFIVKLFVLSSPILFLC